MFRHKNARLGHGCGYNSLNALGTVAIQKVSRVKILIVARKCFYLALPKLGHGSLICKLQRAASINNRQPLAPLVFIRE